VTLKRIPPPTFFISQWHAFPEAIFGIRFHFFLILPTGEWHFLRMSSVVIFRKRGTFWISMTGASLSCCLSGVINLGSAECHYCRSRMVVQTLEFVFHCLKIFKACRTFFHHRVDFPSDSFYYHFRIFYIFFVFGLSPIQTVVSRRQTYMRSIPFCTGVEPFQYR
jgi:hypothetical protein